MPPEADFADTLKNVARRLQEIAHEPESASRSDLQDVLIELLGARDRAFGTPTRSVGRDGAKSRILDFLKSHVGEVVSGSQLAEVSGIQEWGRRVRELRVEEGWQIEEVGGSRYTLRTIEKNESAADRWALLNGIRSRDGSAADRIRTLLEATVGNKISRDEVDYVAKVKEGVRRLREIRDEEGWPIESHIDNPELSPGEYRLASSDPSDRRDVSQRLYPDNLREQVFARDAYTCQKCGRNRTAAEAAGDKRFYLEVHHKIAIADELAQLPKRERHDIRNLTTLCHKDHIEETARLQRRKRETRGP
jgi:hypothetical protein